MRTQVTSEAAQPDAVRLPTASRRWLTTVVVAAAVALCAACVNSDSGPPPAPTTHEVDECLVNFSTLSLPVMVTPIERMELGSGDGWLRVYVSEPSKWIIACQGGPDGMTGSLDTVMKPAEGLSFYGGYNEVSRARLLLGHLPAGAADVEARLADGQVVKGDHDGTIFVIWAPGGLQVDNAQVTAYAQDRTVLATAAAPAE